MPNIRAQRIDITALASDAIVNAANPQLLGGGGVDGAIHRAAGPELLAACRALPELRRGVRCETGEARITPGFRLRARHVIHTVGPIWQGGKADEDRLLSNCYRNSVALASAHGLTSLAFPAISCGVYGYPHPRACRVAVAALRAYPWQDASVQDVVLTAFDAAMLKLWAAALAQPN